jgi:hypothetical protein
MGYAQTMRASPLKYALAGASVMAVISTAYVCFGPMDFLGFPEPCWAAILFYPGSIVGLWTWNHVSHSMPVCYTVGVLMMTVVGGIIGLGIEWAPRRWLHRIPTK